MNRRVGSFSRLVLAGQCLAVLILLIGGPPLRAQMAPDDYRQGTHVFRYILEKSRFEFVEDLTGEDPSRCLVVVLGDAEPLKNIPKGMQTFLNGGGAVLIATDHAVTDGPLPEKYGIVVSGEILSDDRKEETYRRLAACPFVTVGPGSESDLFRSLETPARDGRTDIATNLPSYLETHWRQLFRAFPSIAIAYMPSGCYVRNNPAKRRELLFGIGLKTGNKEEGRLLVLADHSIFINEMMQQSDNGNAAFAFRAISWLNDSGKRNRVLFIENGTVKTEADIKIQPLPNPPVPPPSLDSIIGMGDQLLAGLEGEDFFNRALVNLVPPQVLLRWMLYLITAGFLLYGLSRLLKGRHRVDPGTPLLATAVAGATPSVNPIEHRNRALLESGNLAEPARLLALQFFETLIGPKVHQPASESAVRLRLPPFQVKLRGLRGWLLGQRVRRLWRIAHMASPQAVNVSQFRRLTRQVGDLKEAARRGTLRFTSVTPTSGLR